MRTRFAPSPTGPLHLGHAYAAMMAHDMALREGGEFLLRVEDIDRQRSKPEWEEAIYDDLAWLGLSWETPVMRQSERLEAYSAALDDLWARGRLYPCDCTRRDIAEALGAPQEGVSDGPDGPVYPGTCRHKARGGARPGNQALRLDMGQVGAALERTRFDEAGHGPNGECGWIETSSDHLTDRIGDVVLARRDMGASYHLSVVIDDAAQGITHVTRGEDLFEATRIHVVLQKLLKLPTPTYHHHRLIRDDAGKRLAKRDDARSIRSYRADGASPADIRRMVGL
jgi:glutamyl-Q tRNA(Asp) synthetase